MPVSTILKAGLSLGLGVVVTGCHSSGTEAYGVAGCGTTATISEISYSMATPLGFSADDFLKGVERNDQVVAFEWVPYDQALIAASDPPAGAQTTAMVSIARSTTPPRWVQNKSNDCLSYLELVVDYSITTADGLLAEKVPVTLTEIKDVATGGGEAVLEPGQFGGTFTLSTAPGTNVRTILGLAVQKSTTFGGFLLRYDGPQANSVSQVILGRWPPDS